MMLQGQAGVVIQPMMSEKQEGWLGLRLLLLLDKDLLRGWLGLFGCLAPVVVVIVLYS